MPRLSKIGAASLAAFGFTAGSIGAYTLSKSLRFRKSATAYLSKTYGTSPTSRTTMSMSFWAKRGSLSNGSTQAIFGTGNNYENVTFYSDDTIRFTGPYSSGQQGAYITTQVFRDPAAWYHIVAVYDTTNATAANRMRLYVNGVQVTSFSTQTTSNQNNTTTEWLVSGFQSNVASTGGGGGANLFDGYLAEMNIIDGQALTPSSFGATDATTGAWQPIAYTGTYGTNGFYLPFTNTTSTATLGNDSSGNSNTWTVNNISLTAGSTYDSMTDVPTLTSATAANYAVLNPLSQSSSGNPPTAGNLNPNGGNDMGATMAFPATGNFYCEGQWTNATQACHFGVISLSLPITSVLTGGSIYYRNDGAIYINNSLITTVASYAAGDIIATTVNTSTGAVIFYKNNTSVYSTNLSAASLTATTSTFGGRWNSGCTAAMNYGQQPFVYTPPSGFVALNTYNL